MKNEIQIWLNENTDKAYRNFALSLLPGVSNLYGVWLPLLRKKTKEIAAKEENASSEYVLGKSFEEVMIRVW